MMAERKGKTWFYLPDDSIATFSSIPSSGPVCRRCGKSADLHIFIDHAYEPFEPTLSLESDKVKHDDEITIFKSMAYGWESLRDPTWREMLREDLRTWALFILSGLASGLFFCSFWTLLHG